MRRWVRLIGDRGKDNRGGDVFVEARGWEEEMYGESSKKQDEQRSGIATDCAS